MQLVPVLLAAMAASALSAPCAVETLDRIEAQLLAFPTLKACDAPTPGWSFYAFYTEDNAFPTSAQTSIFESYPACQTVYKAFQDVVSGTPACDFYPNEPLQKLASFPQFRDLVSYMQSHEARAGETTTLAPPTHSSSNNNNNTNDSSNDNNNSSSNATPTPPLARCNVADVGSITAQIKAIPQAAQCANVTKFDFDAFFAQTNVFPSASQVALFQSTPACDVLLSDVKIILRQGLNCNFYENVSLQKMATMTNLQDLVSLEMVHDHPGAQVATTATPTATSDGTTTKSTSESDVAASGVSAVGAVAIAAAAILVVAGAAWAIRRKRQQDTKGDDTQQSIYVVNAHSAL